MLYVGQTSQVNFDKYCGSGRYWTPHCKKHGGYNRDNIEVLEQSWFEDKKDANLWLKMLNEDCPKYWESDNYANQVPEDLSDSPFIHSEFHKSEVVKEGWKKALTKINENHKKNNTGLFNKDYANVIRKRGHETSKKNKVGFYDIEVSKKGNEVNRINKTGLWDPKTHKLRFKCLECEMVTNIGGLSFHQKASGHFGKTKVN